MTDPREALMRPNYDQNGKFICKGYILHCHTAEIDIGGLFILYHDCVCT